MIPPTRLIHLTYDGNFQHQCEAVVLHASTLIDPIKDSSFLSFENATTVQQWMELILDVTVMHPQGGGQPSDQGTIYNNQARLVIERVVCVRPENIVKHIGFIVSEKSQIDGMQHTIESLFPLGSKVHVQLDSERRTLLSECHTAGHVVDAAMAMCNTILPPEKGYHFLDGPYVEYSGNIPLENRNQLLSSLQEAFHNLLEQDIATKIQTLTKSEADSVCNRLQKNFDLSQYDSDEIRIVTVAGWPCPCGGTHVLSTGALKKNGWNILGIKCKKGVVRIRYGTR